MALRPTPTTARGPLIGRDAIPTVAAGSCDLFTWLQRSTDNAIEAIRIGNGNVSNLDWIGNVNNVSVKQ